MTKEEYKKLYNKLDKYVKEHVKESRYEHTQRVVKAAEKFAIKYGADVDKARIVAVFHDACKNDVGGLEHGEAAAKLIQDKFNVTDPDIIAAIANHTIGRPNMCLLEKIIKLADLLEEGRDFEDVPKIRKFEEHHNNIDETYLLLAERQKAALIRRGIKYDTRIDGLIDWLTEEINKKND